MIQSVYFFLAFLLSLLAISAVLFLGGIAKSLPTRMFQGLMYLLVLASAVTVGLSGRSLRLIDDALTIANEGDVSGFIGGKVLLALAIGFSVALSVAWLMRGWWRRQPPDRYGSVGRLPPTDILGALLVFYVAFSIVPIALTSEHYFHVSLVYPFFIFLALLLWIRYSSVDPVRVVKHTLVVLVAGSLAAAVVAPSLALQPGYAGLIPGFTQRLWGITANANTLGSAALALLLIEVCEPAEKRWLHVALLTAALAAMVLSQSKAALGAGVLGSVGVLVWRWVLQVRARTPHRDGRGELAALFAFLAVLALAIGAIWVLVAAPDLFGSFGKRLNARAVGDLSTATGRIYIWNFAFESGLQSPLYGHGGNFWGLETRLRTGLSGATHAHNQFLQVFSRSGLIGLTSYFAFLGLLIAYAWRGRNVTRGGSLVFVVVFITRSMVEVPLQPNSVLGAEFFAFMTMLVYVVDRGVRQVVLNEARPQLASPAYTVQS